MGTVIVIAFSTLDGFASDPDGALGTPGGGWAFRTGPRAVADDKFRLGAAMETGVMLLGRGTWQLFAARWPGRTGPFADRMNAMAKLVASRSLTDVSGWANSSLLDGDLTAAVKQRRDRQDVVVAGSLSIVHTLIAADLVDDYRLLTFPVVLGHGTRLFPDGVRPADLTCRQAEPVGEAVFSSWARG
jgi:dihydrofolate reductase